MPRGGPILISLSFAEVRTGFRLPPPTNSQNGNLVIPARSFPQPSTAHLNIYFFLVTCDLYSRSPKVKLWLHARQSHQFRQPNSGMEPQWPRTCLPRSQLSHLCPRL